MFQLGDGVSLLLFSSEFFYDDMELLAVAEVSFCDPNNEFSFQWKIDGLDDGEVETVKGNSLKLAKGTFKFGMSIVITVAVLNNQSETMASVINYFSHKFFQLKIFFSSRLCL